MTLSRATLSTWTGGVRGPQFNDPCITFKDIIDFVSDISITPSEEAKELFFRMTTNANFNNVASMVNRGMQEESVIRYILTCRCQLCFAVADLFHSIYPDLTENGYNCPMVSPAANHSIEKLSITSGAAQFRSVTIQLLTDLRLGVIQDVPVTRLKFYDLLSDGMRENIYNTIATSLTSSESTKRIAGNELVQRLYGVTGLLGALLPFKTTKSFNTTVCSNQITDIELISRLPNDVILMLTAKRLRVPNWLKSAQIRSGSTTSQEQFIRLSRATMPFIG
ncbi:MAG: hypothetical protein GY804_08650 [Alphaproteobacteria bacterium]|nr:hypothetical protein [Alphaproteobacteria bacterium]